MANGKIGNTALLNGNNFIQIEDNDVLSVPLRGQRVNIANDLTFMAWINPQAVTGTQRLLAPDRRLSDNGIGLGLQGDKVMLTVYPSQDYVSTATVKAGVWQQVAVVINKETNQADFYVDGLLRSSLPVVISTRNQDEPYLVGAHITPGGVAEQIFSGGLDNLVVYGRSLNASYIQNSYFSDLFHYSDNASARVTVDADVPIINLVNNNTYRALGNNTFILSVKDASSDVVLVRYRLLGSTEDIRGMARACSPLSQRTVGWCFSDLLNEKGEWTLILEAVDTVGNTSTATYTFYVEDKGPTATIDTPFFRTFVTANVVGAADDQVWSLTLGGTINDPEAETSVGGPIIVDGVRLPGSGIDLETVWVALIDAKGTVLGGSPQLATVNGSRWTVNYRIVGERINERYSVELYAADLLGNTATTQLDTIGVDTELPSVYIDPFSLPTDAVAGVHTFSGYAYDRPDTTADGVSFLFRESNGATSFRDSYKYALDPGGAPIVLTCNEAANECPSHSWGILYFNYTGGGNDTLVAQSQNLSNLGPDLTVSLYVEPDSFPTGEAEANLLSLETVTHTNFLVAIDANQQIRLSARISGTTHTLLVPGVLTLDELQHLVATYDGNALRLYRDGLEVGALENITGTLTASNILRLGSNTQPYDGSIWEVTLYDEAFSANEVAQLFDTFGSGLGTVDVWLEPFNFDGARAAENWQPIFVTGYYDSWQYTIPSSGLEDFYLLNVRATDSQGNLSPTNNFWRGVIDNTPPRITLAAENVGAGNSARTVYTFSVDDLFLDVQSAVHPCGAFIETQTDPDSGRVNRLSNSSIGATSLCQIDGHFEGIVTVRACDVGGLCSSQSIALSAPPPTNFIDVEMPLSGTVWPVGTAIHVAGSSRAAAEIFEVSVSINGGFPEYLYPNGSQSEFAWSTTQPWTPTVAGTYTITANMLNGLEQLFTDVAVVTIVNAPIGNNAPVAGNDVASTNVGTSVSINVLANDTDPDGDAVLVNGFNQPANGAVSLSNSVLIYTPGNGFTGNDSFGYFVGDGKGGVAQATVTVTVSSGSNNAPSAVDDNVAATEDSSVSIDVLSNDSDADGDTLAVLNYSQPVKGSLVVSGSTFIYTPTPNFFGADSFIYTVHDGNGGSDTGWVFVVVNGVQDAPVAQDDVVTTNEDTAVTIDVLGNDGDSDGDNLTVSAITRQPLYGNVVNNGVNVLYTPNTNYNGSDSFVYGVSDGVTGPVTATVTVTVTAVNDAPIAVSDEITTPINTAVTIDVLANDSDVEGDNISLDGIATLPGRGVAQIVGSVVVYTPTNNLTGWDTFQYRVRDTLGATQTGTVNVLVNLPYCGSIADEVQLNNCIQFANNTSGKDLLTLAADITLTAPAMPLSSTITMNGNGYAVDGNNSVSIFEVTAKGKAAIDNITLRNGNAGTVANNNDFGGAILNLGVVTVTNSVISNNTAYEGGGIWHGGLVMTIGNSTIAGNTSINRGGAIYTQRKLTIINSLIRANTSTGGSGAGIHNQAGSGDRLLKVINTTISGNSAYGPGGGIYNSFESTLALIHSTIATNTTYLYGSLGGGGLRTTDGMSLNILVKNTVIVGNKSAVSNPNEHPSDCNIFSYPGSWPVEYQSLGGNVLGVGCGLLITGNDRVANQLATELEPNLADNGGDTWTHALPLTSQAIDLALDCTDTDGTPITTDQRGVARPKNNACDSGAYEADINLPPLAVNDVYTATEDVTLTVSVPGVLANDSDPEGQTLTVTLISMASSGVVTLNSDGSFVYMAVANQCGSDSFTYAANDGRNGSNTATVSLNIVCVPDAPTAVDDSVVTNEDVAVTIAVLANDSDGDGNALTINSVTSASNGVVVNNGGDVTYTPNGTLTQFWQRKDVTDYVRYINILIPRLSGRTSIFGVACEQKKNKTDVGLIFHRGKT